MIYVYFHSFYFFLRQKISPITRVFSRRHNFPLPQELFHDTKTSPSHKDFKFLQKFCFTAGFPTHQQKFLLPREFSFCFDMKTKPCKKQSGRIRRQQTSFLSYLYPLSYYYPLSHFCL